MSTFKGHGCEAVVPEAASTIIRSRQGRAWGYDRLIPLALVLLVGALFGRSVTFDFVNYDELQHVIDNPEIRSLKPSIIWQTFSDFSKRSYYPVRQLSFAVDYAFWGLRPGGYHLTNVVLHALSTCLLYLLLLRALRRLACNPGDPLDVPAASAANLRLSIAAGLGAALFAVHPVVVEPVTWVSGREELLMVLFGLSCLHAHQSARELAERKRRGETISTWRLWSWRLAAWLSFVCACLSNAVGAIIPALVLMHDLVIGRVRSVRHLLLAHGPMWLLAGGVVALKLAHRSVRSPTDRLPLLVDMTTAERLYTAISIYAYDCRTILWPRGLILAYPNLLVQSFFALCTLMGLLLIVFTLCLLWRLRRSPVALAGALWFLLALAPSAQLVPHHIFRADRFLYLPMAGLAWVAAAALAAAFRVPSRGWPSGLAWGMVLAVLGALTWQQIGQWRNTVTLFTHCIRFNPLDPQSYNIRAMAYSESRQHELALHDLDRAVELAPADAGYRINRARVHSDLGHLKEAILDYNQAITLQSTDTDVYNKRGLALLKEGRYDQAIQDFGRAAALQLKDASAYFNRANAYMGQQNEDAAIADYTEALRLQPEYVEALNNRGSAYLNKGQDAQAVADFEHTLKLNPSYAKAYLNLGSLHARRDRYPQAIESFNRALALEPQNGEAVLSRARAYLRSGRADLAAADYERFTAKEPKHAAAHKEWGNACAAMKAFDLAIEHYSRSIELAPDDTDGYNRRGISLAERGDVDAAIRDFTKAIELSPADASGYANRGIAFARRREIDQARQDWQRVIELDSTGQLGAKARRSLEHLLAQPAAAGGEASHSQPG